jgi:glucosamine--fructose-6-phosphate aminotransferase (isomerizing)
VAAAKASGATILALCNSPEAPLVTAADWVIDLRAGVETSVAATKSYLASLAALARLVAAWTQDAALQSMIESLPALMEESWKLDWSPALEVLEPATNLYVVGRGLGLGAAQETALKCKETCGLHAEAFSSAEVKHGPYALLGENFPALLFAQRDASLEGVAGLAAELARRGVPVLLAGAEAPGAVVLPVKESAPDIAPILRVQSAYRLIASLAVRRGFDPDHPPHLRKVTETV